MKLMDTLWIRMKMTVEIKRKQTIEMEIAHFTGPDEAIYYRQEYTALHC